MRLLVLIWKILAWTESTPGSFTIRYMKRVRIRSFSGPYSVWIQSECGKMRTRKTFQLQHFSRSDQWRLSKRFDWAIHKFSLLEIVVSARSWLFSLWMCLIFWNAVMLISKFFSLKNEVCILLDNAQLIANFKNQSLFAVRISKFHTM